MAALGLLTVFGLAMTLAGAQAVVWAANDIATEAGLSGGFVGFTLVALGTSLPELGTTIIACRKGQTELVVGNLLGSNIFNSLAVGAAIGLIGPGEISDSLLTGRGTYIMIGTVALAYVLALTGKRVNRVEGVVLIAVYVGAIAALA